MPNVSIELIVNMRTGKAELSINGIKGAACRPIHEAVSADLARIAKLEESTADNTPEWTETVESDITVGQSLRA